MMRVVALGGKFLYRRVEKRRLMPDTEDDGIQLLAQQAGLFRGSLPQLRDELRPIYRCS